MIVPLLFLVFLAVGIVSYVISGLFACDNGLWFVGVVCIVFAIASVAIVNLTPCTFPGSEDIFVFMRFGLP